MTSVRYVGGAPVDVPSLDLYGVEPGQTVDVPADAAKSLTAGEDWQRAGTTKTAGTRTKAAKAAPEPDEGATTADPAKED